MPILKYTNSSAPIIVPKSDYKVVKYIDIIKFLSMLQKESLFFCRIDKLEDKFEGKTSKPNYELRKSWYKNSREYSGSIEEDRIIDGKVRDYNSFEEKQRSLHCVNCWNKFTNESNALWKIYSDLNKGLLIKSSISRISNAFEKTTEKLQLSEVKYIDYNKDSMPDGNTNFPIIHKHVAYSYEQEIRLIHHITPLKGWEHDWINQEVEEGLYLKVDLNLLVEEIIISPFAPNWFYELIKNLALKYNLSKNIIKSELSI